MINHARTLLLNMSGSASASNSYPGEEYVDPAFKQVTLPPHITSIRSALFSTSPDRAMINYRLRQFMGILHTRDYVDFITDLDPRITYDVFDTSLFDLSVTGPTAERVDGSGTLYLIGDLEPSNRLYNLWDIQVVDNTQVSVTRLTDPIVQQTSNYTITNNMSNLLPLVGSNLNFKFIGIREDRWLLTVNLRPSSLVEAVSSLEQTNSYDLEQLFTTPNSAEMFTTFRNIWTDNQRPLQDRLAGVLLAIVYRTEELRS